MRGVNEGRLTDSGHRHSYKRIDCGEWRWSYIKLWVNTKWLSDARMEEWPMNGGEVVVSGLNGGERRKTAVNGGGAMERRVWIMDICRK